MDTTNDKSDININLEEDPELSYFTWKVQVEDVASNAATLVEPTGLLTLIVKDPAWEAYPPNQSVSPGGTLHIAPRPVIPAHVPITGGMTNAQISVAKYANDRHEVWHKAKETFKTGVIRSNPQFGTYPVRHHRAPAEQFQEHHIDGHHGCCARPL